MDAVYIVDVLRTPVGKRGGVFAHTRPDTLLTHCIREIVRRHPQIATERVGDVIIGCAMPEAEQGLNIARCATLMAGLPNTVPAMTLNRFCSSGLQSIATAADRIRAGEADIMLAGGVESMSMIPMTGWHIAIHPAVPGPDSKIRGLGYSMGVTAEEVAKKYKVNRKDQDEFSLGSHQRALTAIETKAFEREILPITVVENKVDRHTMEMESAKIDIDQDEGPRADTSAEALARLKPVFAKEGTVTAGNSSQMSDGAGIALLASEQALKDYDLSPMGRLLSFAVVGVPPEVMGIGPVRALPLALKRAGVRAEQLEWVELNEAFAAQSLAVIRGLDLDIEKVNPRGGAIALGHPLGATGAIRSATLLHGLRGRGSPNGKGERYGAVTMCIGQGMGAAAIFSID